jgi:hypothetical protein
LAAPIYLAVLGSLTAHGFSPGKRDGNNNAIFFPELTSKLYDTLGEMKVIDLL